MTYYEPDLYDDQSPSTLEQSGVEEWSVVYVDKYGNTIQWDDEEIDDPWMTESKKIKEKEVFKDERMSFVEEEEEEDDDDGNDTPYWWAWWGGKKKKKKKSSYYADTYYTKYTDKKPTTYYGTGYNGNSYFNWGTNYNSHSLSPSRTFNTYDYSDMWNKFSWSIVSNENRILLKKNFQKISLERLSPWKVTVASMSKIDDLVTVYKNKKSFISVGSNLVKKVSEEKNLNAIFDSVIDIMPMQTDAVDTMIASYWANLLMAKDPKKFRFQSDYLYSLFDKLTDSKVPTKDFEETAYKFFIDKSIGLQELKNMFPELSTLTEDAKKEVDTLMSLLTKWESGWNPISEHGKKQKKEKESNSKEISHNVFNWFWRFVPLTKCWYRDTNNLYGRAVQAMRSKFKPRDIVSKEASLNKGKRINRSFLTWMSYKPLQAKVVEEYKRKKLLIICDSSWSMSSSNIAWVAGAFIKALVDVNIFQIDHIIKHSSSFVHDYLYDYKKLDSTLWHVYYNSDGGWEWFESLDDNIDVRYVKDADYVIVITDLNYSEPAEEWLHRMLQRSKKHMVLVFGDRKWTIKWMNTRNIETIDNMINAVTTILAH